MSSLYQQFIALFYKGKFRALQAYRRAESKSEFSQTSKMKLIDEIVKRFKDINYFCNKLQVRCFIGIEFASLK